MALTRDRFGVEGGLLAQAPGASYIIALDEVGRGCLAGPVMAGASLWAVLTPPDGCPTLGKDSSDLDPHNIQPLWLPLINDSKALTERKRRIAFDAVSHSFAHLRDVPLIDRLRNALALPVTPSTLILPPEERVWVHGDVIPDERPCHLVCQAVSVGAASVKEIDAHNIWVGVQIAMARAVAALGLPDRPNPSDFLIVVDGKTPIRVPKTFAMVPQATLINGDAKSVCIGLSSILAKVIRDDYMSKILDSRYPGYELSRHKGYATKVHRDNIKKLGISPMHRRSFLKGFSSGV